MPTNKFEAIIVMKKLRIILTGADGQLGQSVQTVASRDFTEIEVVPTNRSTLDVSQQGVLEDFVRRHPSSLPTLLVNCAAYTAVDKAETEDEEAYELNSFAPGFLAYSCSLMDMMMIHISTDYVFDGTAQEPYAEDDEAKPLSVYGASKAVGEENVRRFLGLRSVTIRTSWLYSPYGKNFVKTMIRLSHEREQIAVVDDQLGSPTYAPHLADAILHIALDAVERGYFPYSTIHYTNKGACSWCKLAEYSINLMGNKACQVKAISSEEYTQTQAKRPKYSILSLKRLEETYGITPPRWEEGLLEMSLSSNTSKSN